MGKDAVPPPERLAEIEDVTRRAQAGDQSAVPRLRELLEEFPQMGAYFGDLAHQAEAIWVALAAGSDLYMQEALLHKIATIREELTGGSPNPVLGLLVDRVILSWLSANYYAAMEGCALRQQENPKLIAFRTKRRLLAERSHLTALAALVTLRKLLPPPPEAVNGKASKIPPPADARAVTNRLSAYFADLSFSPPASRKEPAAVN